MATHYIAHRSAEGWSVIASTPGNNAKTRGFARLTIIPTSWITDGVPDAIGDDPEAEYATGCDTCPLSLRAARATDPSARVGDCYVHTVTHGWREVRAIVAGANDALLRHAGASGQAPATVATAAVTGGGAIPLRSAVYGEPARIPADVWTRIAAGATPPGRGQRPNVVGYTHGWRYAPHLRTTHRASVHSAGAAAAATAAGWRVYLSGKAPRLMETERTLDARAIPWSACPLDARAAATADNDVHRPKACDTCRACHASSDAPAVITMADHGPRRARVAASLLTKRIHGGTRG